MRTRIKMTAALAALVLTAAGCPSDDDNAGLGDAGVNNENNENNENNGTDMGGGGDDTGGNNMTDMGGGGDDMGGGGGDMGGGDDMGADMAPTSPWAMTAHSCVGNRTDTLWCDDDQTCFVGCGTTTTGNIGLFQTTDGGATWAAPTTNPAGFFDSARVNTIWRDDAGTLFVGGDLPNSAGVVALDSAGALTPVFTRGATVDLSFTVGNFRRAPSGFAIAESLTGVDLVQREMDGGDPTDSWTTGRGFWNDGDPDDVAAGVQILDLEVYNGEFWGVGSRISDPPMVFSPKWLAGDFDFGITPLSEGLGEFNGELWGIDVNADGVAVGGVDQARNVGKVYTLSTGGDPTDIASWTEFDLDGIFPGNTTWVTDVCRATGNVVYATGRESSQGWGFVLRSPDGGANWEDITPYDDMDNSVFDDVSRCHALSDGVIVAGADGLFARFTAP